MKIGIKTCNKFGHKLREGDAPFTYTHLIIENLDDLVLYNEPYKEINSEKNVNALMGFKSQTFRSTFGDYLAHEQPSASPVSKLMGFKLALKETDTSIQEFCQMSDDIMSNKLVSMYKYLDKGLLIRINNSGGYCSIDEIEWYDELFEPTNKQLISFINTGKVETDALVINNRTVVIENSENISKEFTNDIKNQGVFNPQILNNFKLKTGLLKDEEIFKIFQDGINRGMRRICFETTGQDFHNISKLFRIFTALKEANPKTTLKLIAKTNDNRTKELFKNENIIFT